MADIYEMSSSGQDFSAVDDLLDFSNDHGDVIFSSSATDHYNIILHNTTPNSYHFQYQANHNNIPTNSTDGLCLPSNDVAELEWLSNFVHDSLSDYPENNIVGTINYRPDNKNTSSFHSRSRSKRLTRAPTNNNSWSSSATPSPTGLSDETTTMKLKPYSSSPSCSSEAEIARRCTHCASEKTPQWRTGPLGPKTLCNACGVRYKSGRLVPEYRPAASPTFVLAQHSNSHRKVMELRRQKEMMQQSPTPEYQIYGGGDHHHRHRNRNNYEVC